MALRALIKMIVRGRGVIINRSIKRGVIFCQVARRIQMGQVILDITWGNQKCIGAAPSLVAKPMMSTGEGLRGGERNRGV